MTCSKVLHMTLFTLRLSLVSRFLFNLSFLLFRFSVRLAICKQKFLTFSFLGTKKIRGAKSLLPYVCECMCLWAHESMCLWKHIFVFCLNEPQGDWGWRIGQSNVDVISYPDVRSQ